MRGSRSATAVVVVVAALAGAGTAAVGARTAASPFQLVFDGRPNADLLHEGTFTTSAAFCPSGEAVDASVDGTTDTTTRTFRCSGSGEFTARVTPLPAEHGGGGSWQIAGGSVDFDVSPPTVAATSAAVRKLKRPKGAYSLRVVVSLTDAEGNPVAYRLKVIDPRKPVDPLVSKTGETSSGTVTYVARVRPTPRTRTLQVKIDASDPVGNASAVARTLRLR